MNSNIKLSIVMLVPGLQASGKILREQSLGGSETAGVQMAEALAKIGHEVIVFSNLPNGKPDKQFGVQYMPIQDFDLYTQTVPHDVLIIQRTPQALSIKRSSKMNILWLHDLATKQVRDQIKGIMWNVDKILVLSQFHKEQVQKVYGFPDEIIYITRNGIDPELLPSGEYIRDKNSILYSARPERGLINLLSALPRLLEKIPDLKLHVTTYKNDLPGMEGLYNHVNHIISQFSNNIKVYDGLRKQDLYRLMKTCTLYAYPTEFEEVSCITAMECQANSLPFISTTRGALPETAGDAGILIDHIAPDWGEQWVNAIIGILSNPQITKEEWEPIIKGWDEVAIDWTNLFLNMFTSYTSNKEVLIRHFLYNEDVMAAIHVAEGERKQGIIDDYSKVLGGDSNYKEFYDECADHELDTNPAVADVTTPARYNFCAEMIRQYKPKKVLDYACAGGAYTKKLAAEFPDIQFEGVDISAQYIEAAKINAPDNVKFSTIDELYKTDYDMIIPMEIMEHVPAPDEFIDKLESHLSDGGVIVGTVPSGPWGSILTEKSADKRKAHLWGFEKADLNDMFKDKKDFQIWFSTAGRSPRDGDPIGWLLFKYVKNGEPTHMPDFERKALIQSPRPSISACIIAKDAEGSIKKSIDSYHDICDQIIVVVDKNTTDKTMAIAQEEGAEVYVGESPIEMGFDYARNFAISKATGDWIFWPDSDEELCNARNVLKYLRPNMYNGIAPCQHHLSVDPAGNLPMDYPVKFFRNNKGIKFYGILHEHPELEINKSVGEAIVARDVHIAHTGYYTEEGRQRKFERNLPLMLRDREVNPSRRLGAFLMIRDWAQLAVKTRDANRGMITQQVEEFCWNAINAYRQDFLGHKDHFAKDGLQFYSAALAILGIGFEAKFDMAINGVPGGLQVFGRFLDDGDMKKYIDSQMDVLIEPITGEYVR